MNNNFYQKKILLICPRFFDYEIEIKATLEKLGASVEFFDERPKNSFFTKVLIRSGLKFFLTRRINSYYQVLFEIASKQVFDTVLIINPEVIDSTKLQYLRSLQPNARFILYMWDSFKNKKGSRDLVYLFDKKVTFDRQDSTRYGLEFLPLFYINAYSENSVKSDFKYDISFIGTAHSDRYKTAKIIENIAKGFDLKVFLYFFLPNAAMFWIRKFFFSSYQYGEIGEFSFSSLSHREVASIFKSSKVILDINHPEQAGLTSRSIEALGAKRKLITTNKNIVDYDFFNDQNIYVLDRDNPFVNEAFFKSDYYHLKEAIYEKYSIRSWLIQLFNWEDN